MPHFSGPQFPDLESGTELGKINKCPGNHKGAINSRISDHSPASGSVSPLLNPLPPYTVLSGAPSTHTPFLLLPGQPIALGVPSQGPTSLLPASGALDVEILPFHKARHLIVLLIEARCCARESYFLSHICGYKRHSQSSEARVSRKRAPEQAFLFPIWPPRPLLLSVRKEVCPDTHPSPRFPSLHLHKAEKGVGRVLWNREGIFQEIRFKFLPDH